MEGNRKMTPWLPLDNLTDVNSAKRQMCGFYRQGRNFEHWIPDNICRYSWRVEVR